MELSRAVRRITVPEAIGGASLRAFGAELERAAEDRDATVWILAGRPGTFCRGMDLGALSNGVGPADDGGPSAFADCLVRLCEAPRATIALVDGEALGGGLGLAAACDLVLATPRSTFGLPEGLFGLLPAMVMPVLLERLSPQKARLLALAGTRRDAAWAREHGLVDEIVADVAIETAFSRSARDMGRAAGAALELRGLVADASRRAPVDAIRRGVAITTELLADPKVRGVVRDFVENGVAPWEPR